MGNLRKLQKRRTASAAFCKAALRTAAETGKRPITQRVFFPLIVQRLPWYISRSRKKQPRLARIGSLNRLKTDAPAP